MLETVRASVHEHGLLRDGQAVVAGVSGGRDSMALLHALHALGYDVHAGHVHYGLRGADADADQALVRAFCADRGLPFHTVRRDVAAEADRRGTSLQDAARTLRYAWLRSVAEAAGIEAVAVAHHRDDQAETVLLNLARGTGPEGLAGMPPSRPLGGAVRLVRPMLRVGRGEVDAYVRTHAVPWREDATNQDAGYRRNAVRHAVLPAFADAFGPGVSARIAAAAARMQGYLAASFEPELAAHRAACRIEGEAALALAPLRALPPVWRRRVLLDAAAAWLPGAPFVAATAETLEALLDAQPGRRWATDAGTVWRGRDQLVFEAPSPDPAPGDGPAAPTPVAVGAPAERPEGTLVLEPVGERGAPGDPLVEYLDADALGGRLVLRRWAAGDRIRPLGMEGSRLVSDVLTDARVPVHRRREALVLTSGDEVVWLVGHRIAHAARVRPATARVVRARWKPR